MARVKRTTDDKVGASPSKMIPRSMKNRSLKTVQPRQYLPSSKKASDLAARWLAQQQLTNEFQLLSINETQSNRRRLDFKRRSSSGSSTVQSNGTIHKFNPLLSRIDEDGNAVDVINRYQCVTLMKEYENKSLEELRYEDYRQANRRHTMDTTTENRLKYSVNLIGNLYASRLSTETNKPGIFSNL